MNKIIIFMIISLFCSFTLIFFNNNYKNTSNNEQEINQQVIKEDNNTNNILKEEQQLVAEPIVAEKEESIVIPETYTTMYATVRLNIRELPNKESNIIDVININTELTTVDNSNENGWIKIKMNDNYYYVASEYLSTIKVEIQPKIIENKNQNVNTTSRNNTNKTRNNIEVLTKSKGVNYFNGHRETWYSQKVLPGKGLKIPGRHVDSRGLVCDGDGYICVASSDYPKGTIVETSLGTGKVYDCGCAKNTIDIYCNW